MKKLFAGDLWPMLTTESGIKRMTRFESHLTVPLETLIESLVLYDEIVIPTQDFLIIPVLLRAIGENPFRDLLERGAIKFLRMKKGIAFFAGVGARSYYIKKKNGEMLPFAADLDDAIRRACTGAPGNAADPAGLIRTLSSITSEILADELQPVFQTESENDVLGSEEIREFFSLPNVHPREYPGKPNMVDFCGGPGVSSEKREINAYLRLVQSNVEVSLADRAGCDDIASATDLDITMAGKFARSGQSDVVSNLLEIADIPNFAPLVRTGQIPMEHLLKLRESKDGKAFRDWFHGNLRTADLKTVSKEYINLIKKIPAVDRIPSRLMRILGWTAVSAAVGTLAGPIGTAAGAVIGVGGGLLDSFVLSRLRLGGSPKVFLDKLRGQVKNSSK